MVVMIGLSIRHHVGLLLPLISIQFAMCGSIPPQAPAPLETRDRDCNRSRLHSACSCRTARVSAVCWFSTVRSRVVRSSSVRRLGVLDQRASRRAARRDSQRSRGTARRNGRSNRHSGLPPLPPTFRLRDHNILFVAIDAICFDATSVFIVQRRAGPGTSLFPFRAPPAHPRCLEKSRHAAAPAPFAHAAFIHDVQLDLMPLRQHRRLITTIRPFRTVALITSIEPQT